MDTIADVGLIASGRTLEEIFSNMAKGLFSLITSLSYVRNKTSREIELEAPSMDELLVAWLNELIFIHEVENLLFHKFDLKLIDINRLWAFAAILNQ